MVVRKVDKRMSRFSYIVVGMRSSSQDLARVLDDYCALILLSGFSWVDAD